MTGFRERPDEQARISSLMQLLPPGKNVLEIGARDGYITRLLASRYHETTALDLTEPEIEGPGITSIAGDIRALPWDKNHFDVVLCSEVLEHIPPADLDKACEELVRVARRHIVIGVPYNQDIRNGRTRCAQCGAINPPWGHVNRFDENRLKNLFHPMRSVKQDQVGETRGATNVISDLLNRAAGYPWGTYIQDEPCIQCGGSVGPGPTHTIYTRILSGIAIRLDRFLTNYRQPKAKWIHILFEKTSD